MAEGGMGAHGGNGGKKRRRGGARFEPAYETFGPMRNAAGGHIKYRPPALRQHCRENLASQKGSVANLHWDDTLRRVSVVVHRHVLVCERRKLYSRRAEALGPRMAGAASGTAGKRRSRDSGTEGEWEDSDDGRHSHASRASRPSRDASGAHSASQGTSVRGQGGAHNQFESGYRGALGVDALDGEDASALLDEDSYLKSQWKYAFIRLPRLPLWTPYRMERVVREPEVPTVEQIYSFMRHLYQEAMLESECCVVCLVYVERLMERAGVELFATNWRPIIMAGMLLASKVWQDLSSWNIEFARVYPQFSVQSINRLERNVLKLLQWDLFISGAVYAKYYFALRSLNESKNFRRRYNYIIRVNAPNAKQLEKRSAQASSSLFSRSV